MENLTNILLGFQIGFLLSAFWYAWKIRKLQITPSLPYKIAMLALGVMTFWRVEKIFTFFPEMVATVATTIVTILWLVFFINLYTLIKDKDI